MVDRDSMVLACPTTASETCGWGRGKIGLRAVHMGIWDGLDVLAGTGGVSVTLDEGKEVIVGRHIVMLGRVWFREVVSEAIVAYKAGSLTCKVASDQ